MGSFGQLRCTAGPGERGGSQSRLNQLSRLRSRRHQAQGAWNVGCELGRPPGKAIAQVLDEPRPAREDVSSGCLLEAARRIGALLCPEGTLAVVPLHPSVDTAHPA